ncbi:MAG: flippase [Patescibacteria group bacterium]
MIDASLNKINRLVPQKWKWILDHEGFRKYFKNTGWMFFAKILSLIISFLTTAFIARRLGPENYGQLSYAVSFVGIFSFIATLGLDQVLFRDLIKYPEKKNIFLGSAFIIKLIAGSFTIALCLGVALLFSQKDVSSILIFIISSTFLFNAFQVINYEFQARVNSKYPSLVSLLVVLILSLLKILVIVSGRGVIYLALILLLESVLYAVFFIVIYKTKIKSSILDWKYDKIIARNLIRDSWPMIFASAFALIYSRIDQVMIKQMIDASSVGLYDAAVRVAEAWYFVPGIIVTSLFPAIINAKMGSKEQYLKRLRKLMMLLLLLAVFVAIPITFLAPLIIKILYGEAFIGSIIILKIYIWAGVGVSVGSLINSYLVAENFRKILFASSFIAMISNVILNIVFIPRYGIIGSAWATLISYSLGPISILLFSKTRKNIIKIVFIT